MLNQSTSKSSFFIVYTKAPNHIVDLIPSPKLKSKAVGTLAELLTQLHKKVKAKLEESNAKYAFAANKHHRVKTFADGDLVMVYLQKNRFPTGTYKKLKAKKLCPFPILQKQGDNAYILDLPSNLHISSTFNISDFYEYHPPDVALKS